MTVQVGDIIDHKYRVVRKLGEGGMGEVYEGENIRIKRRVAIKVLHAKLAKKADVVKRFEREAQAAAQIGSDHIVDVLDLGDFPDGDLYMVMEFLEGESLETRLRRLDRLSVEEIFPIALQLLDGLALAHDARIIHRDLKPDNVFLIRHPKTGGDFVKILDFGISKFRSLDGDHKMTQTGAIMGTPYFLSPEQARGNVTIDERVDIYAVGVMLYYALSARVPFESESFTDLLFKIALEDPTSLAELCPQVAPEAIAIVVKAMARERDERYASAAELGAAIAEWLRGHGLDPERPSHLSSGSFYRSAEAERAPDPTPPTVRLATVDPTPTPETAAARTPLPPTVDHLPAATTPGLTLSQAGVPKRSLSWLWIAGALLVLLGFGFVGLRALTAKPAPDTSADPSPASSQTASRETEPSEATPSEVTAGETAAGETAPAKTATAEPSASAPATAPAAPVAKGTPPALAKPPAVPPAPPPPVPVPAPSAGGRLITPSLP